MINKLAAWLAKSCSLNTLVTLACIVFFLSGMLWGALITKVMQ